MMTRVPKVAVLWRGDRETRRTATPQNNRFHRVFEELSAIGICAEPAVYDEEFANEVREQLLTGIDVTSLPIIWDADFLYGPRTASGEDTYVLCEINVSSVFAIPDQAPAEIARLVATRLRNGSALMDGE